MASLQEWKKAVIHLGCLCFSRPVEELEAEYNAPCKPDIAKNWERMQFQGTAIFLKYKSRNYLLTARHVIDEIISKFKAQHGQGVDPSPEELAKQTIFPIICHMPTMDENPMDDQTCNQIGLYDMGYTQTNMCPYTFLEYPMLDLAIISLGRKSCPNTKKFAKGLISLGYSPITIKDVSKEPSKEGADVYTLGFPEFISDIYRSYPSQKIKPISLPVCSFGRISMLHPELPYFWINISILPGNSGGPVIENGKLVGIISSQAAVYMGKSSEQQIMVPSFAKAFKVKFIKDLLEEQIKKDRIALKNGWG